MSQSARRNAGLGDPPRPYYTNDSESANAMIKRAVKFKENEISDFVREMSVMVQQQKDDIESAIFMNWQNRSEIVMFLRPSGSKREPSNEMVTWKSSIKQV